MPTLNINYLDTRWKKVLKGFDFDGALSLIKFPFKKPVIINLTLTDDAKIRELNKNYRGKDKATNVLSFALVDDENFATSLKLFDEVELGDIIVSFDTMEKEAKEKSISLINHFTHLFIHGILHLLGFDHMEDNEAEKMEKMEIKILKKLNINNPYEE